MEDLFFWIKVIKFKKLNNVNLNFYDVILLL